MNHPKSKTGVSFGWLNAAQFLGALNDNIFKLLVIFFLMLLVLFTLTGWILNLVF